MICVRVALVSVIARYKWRRRPSPYPTLLARLMCRPTGIREEALRVNGPFFAEPISKAFKEQTRRRSPLPRQAHHGKMDEAAGRARQVQKRLPNIEASGEVLFGSWEIAKGFLSGLGQS